MPVMLIIAGPNGSGKSTFVASEQGQAVLRTIFGADTKILNADEKAKDIARQRNSHVTDEINLEAAQYIDAMVMASIENGTSFGVETVLSSPKYLAAVRAAAHAGYSVGMIYVCVADSSVNVKRVQARVLDGGHDVPVQKIIGRRARSIEMLREFIPLLDLFLAFDNSSISGGRLLASKPGKDTGTTIFGLGDEIPDLFAVLIDLMRNQGPSAGY